MRFPLPSATETLLLEALLLEPPLFEPGRARAAWAEWSRRVPDPQTLLRSGASDRHRALLPLLAVALEAKRLEIEDGALRTAAVSALLREEQRHQRILEIGRRALGALEPSGRRVLAAGGAPMAARFWKRPESRHSGSPRLVVSGGRLDESCRALEAAGFELVAPLPGGPAEHGVARLADPSGLTLLLSSRLVDVAVRPPLGPRLEDRAVAWQAGGGEWHGPGAAHTLFEVCVEASLATGATSLLWVPDLLAVLGGTEPVEWDELARAAEATAVALPFGPMLRFVAEGFGAPVPVEILARLDQSPRRSRRLDVEEVLVRARAAGRSAAESVIRTAPGPLEALRRALWVAFPSRRFVAQVYGAGSFGSALASYALRPLRWLRGRWQSRRMQSARA